MAGMGVISRAVDKLPSWVRLILMGLGVLACIYGFAHDGWSFIWRVIFSPDL
jgi:hypothetical protein